MPFQLDKSKQKSVNSNRKDHKNVMKNNDKCEPLHATLECTTAPTKSGAAAVTAMKRKENFLRQNAP